MVDWIYWSMAMTVLNFKEALQALINGKVVLRINQPILLRFNGNKFELYDMGYWSEVGSITLDHNDYQEWVVLS
jgi:hypothetical protein